MKAQIPDELKQDVPQTRWGKVLVATPVIMTVVATALAGLASSEMTRAQYARSLAAQQQSKVGDQWSFFQAKRIRGSLARSTLDLLQTTADVRPLSADTLAKFAPAPDAATAAALQKAELPPVPAAVELIPEVKSALAFLEASKPDSEITAVLAKVREEALADSVRAARDRADAFDTATRPINQGLDRLEKSLAGADRDRVRDFTAARLRFTAARYDAEARLNQTVAQFIELQVRQSNFIAERHNRRSQRFFLGMLAAQAAVVVSTFSLAAQKRSMLWTLAAVAGLAAVGFAAYVYFFV